MGFAFCWSRYRCGYHFRHSVGGGDRPGVRYELVENWLNRAGRILASPCLGVQIAIARRPYYRALISEKVRGNATPR